MTRWIFINTRTIRHQALTFIYRCFMLDQKIKPQSLSTEERCWETREEARSTPPLKYNSMRGYCKPKIKTSRPLSYVNTWASTSNHGVLLDHKNVGNGRETARRWQKVWGKEIGSLGRAFSPVFPIHSPSALQLVPYLSSSALRLSHWICDL